MKQSRISFLSIGIVSPGLGFIGFFVLASLLVMIGVGPISMPFLVTKSGFAVTCVIVSVGLFLIYRKVWRDLRFVFLGASLTFAFYGMIFPVISKSFYAMLAVFAITVCIGYLLLAISQLRD